MASNTEVGKAYVQLEINGDGMNEDIVDAVDSAGPGVGKAGEKHGEDYGDGFEEGFFDRITDTLSKGLEKELDKDFKNMGRRLGNSLSKSIGASMEEKIGEVELSVSRMIDGLESKIKAVSGNGSGTGSGPRTPSGGGTNGDDDRTLIQASLVQKMIATVEKERVKAHAEANASIAKADRELVKAQQAIMDTARKNYDAMVKENADVTKRFVETRIKLQQASNLAIEKDDERLMKAQQAIYDRAAKENEKRILNQRRLGSGDSNLGDRVGAAFGAGSRNNALNLLGKTMGGIINLSEKAIGVGTKVGSTFSAGFKAAGDSANTFQASMAGINAVGSTALKGVSSGITSLAASGPAAVGAILAIVAALTIMVTVLGALVAIVTALTSTIVTGLVAGLAVLGGAIGAVVVAGGLLTAAFMSMTDAQKTMLKDAFRPLREEMVGIGQIMLQEMVPAFSTWSMNLQNALALAIPVAHQMGKAFADAGTTITAALSGPGFIALSESLGTYLPSIVAKLSNAFGMFLNGAAGVFSALMPYIDRFAGYLDRVATRFSMWANSAGGQNAIADFMDRALVSLNSLWDAVREFGGVLQELLFSPAAMNAGNSLFDGLANSLANLRQYIADAAASGDLERWLNEGVEFGKELAKALLAITEALINLYNSDVLQLLTTGLEGLALAAQVITGDGISSGISNLGGTFGQLAGPIVGVSDLVSNLAYTISGATKSGTQNIGTMIGSLYSALALAAQLKASISAGTSGGGSVGTGLGGRPEVERVINSGRDALAGTDIPKVKAPKAAKIPKYVNPYKAYAERLIKEAPGIKAQIKMAYAELNKAITDAITEAATTTGGGDAAQSALNKLAESARDSGAQLVQSAQSGLNSAAQSLAGATSKSAAKKALAEVKKAQKDLTAAIKSQKAINKAATIVDAQGQITAGGERVRRLLGGWISGGETLADFAEAREQLAVKISEANQKLVDAINIRDQYNEQVVSGIKSFGSLLTAQAQTINGVQQALTATDITNNLQDRLTKIRKFQDDLRVLLAQGLSNDAYKQLVDAGVEQGGAYADAILQGGTGSVQQINDLTNQINDAANSLGGQASNRLYQAGVDAAQGLVDGLTSLGAQLDSAAARLGESIAASLKRALGIASPSRVMIAAMGYVGDGIEEGLDQQHNKAISASKRLSDQIQVSPEAAVYANSQRGATTAVSGNGTTVTWTGNIVTPTDDPHAVATEVLDELAERL